MNQKGLLDQLKNPKLASAALLLLSQILDQQKCLSFREFERVLHRLDQETMRQCRFAQFKGSSADEKRVLLVLNVYRLRFQTVSNKRAPPLSAEAMTYEQSRLPDVFSDPADYEYFERLFYTWQQQSDRNKLIVQGKRPSALPLRKNASSKSFSSAHASIRRNKSGFLSSHRSVTQDNDSLSDLSSRRDCNGSQKPSQFGSMAVPPRANQQSELQVDESDDSSSSNCTFSSEGLDEDQLE